MKFNNPFSKKNKSLSNKNTGAPSIAKSFSIPAGFLMAGGSDGRLSARQAIAYYDKAAPVAIAVDWVNDEFKNLSLVLRKQDGSIEKEDPLLEFLMQPNQDATQEDFLENLGAIYMLANEVYIIATGNVNSEPAELFIISPEHVTTFIAKDGLLGRIDVQREGSAKETFTRNDPEFRFFNREQNAEIWQIKGFSTINNQLSGSTSSFTGASNQGRSKLRSIRREIEQYIAIATNNLALLDNGMRPSGVIETPDNAVITDDQFERLREQVVNFYSGGANAGNVLILENGLKFVPVSISIKDMDFPQLNKNVTEKILARYKVPSQLVFPVDAAFNTMETAKLNLYDNAVLPMSARLFREITNFMRPRFDLDKDEVIVADLDQISALQMRRNLELKLKKELDVLSTDEIRKEIGRDPVPGGDVVYIPSNLVPIGSTPVEPIAPDTNTTTSSKQLMERKQFFDIMKQQKDDSGERIHSDEQLLKIADDEGLI